MAALQGTDRHAGHPARGPASRLGSTRRTTPSTPSSTWSSRSAPRSCWTSRSPTSQVVARVEPSVQREALTRRSGSTSCRSASTSSTPRRSGDQVGQGATLTPGRPGRRAAAPCDDCHPECDALGLRCRDPSANRRQREIRTAYLLLSPALLLLLVVARLSARRGRSGRASPVCRRSRTDPTAFVGLENYRQQLERPRVLAGRDDHHRLRGRHQRREARARPRASPSSSPARSAAGPSSSSRSSSRGPIRRA